MFITLNWKTLEAALPDMAATFVMFMVASYMTRHEPLHEATQVQWSFWIDDKMEMIWH
jgi:hypothetical protein